MNFAARVLSLVLALSIVAVGVIAETHTVHFTNNCGFGVPTLVQNGNVLSTGADFTSNGPLINAIAFLQTGNCGAAGQGCTLIEFTLINPTSPGSGSGADINLIPPSMFSVPSGFVYTGGCAGVGLTCSTPECSQAARNGDAPQTVCLANNVGIAITFCI